MPDKHEVERRKQIARELKLKARQEFENGLPTTLENFKALFDYLDKQLSEKDCDHSLKLSISFLNLIKPDHTAIIKWLEENGGYCDCEVLANVEGKFDDNAIL